MNTPAASPSTDLPAAVLTATGSPSTAPRRVAASPRRRAATRRHGLIGLLLGLLLAVLLSACTPEEYRAYLESKGVDTSGMSQHDLEGGAAIATAYWTQVIADLVDLHKYDHVLSDDQLARLRACESGGNYAAISPGGAYRGAYQFSQSTWTSVASRHFPKWKNYDPAAAPGIVQDAMARALYLEQGRSPWPVCGQRL